MASRYAVRTRTRGYLPHWELDNAVYFVTFRTAGAVSQAQLQALRLSRFTPDEKRKHVLARLERWLDQHPEQGILSGRVAEIVADAIRFRNGRDYELLAWCVMPNHVHLLFKLSAGCSLAPVFRKLKSYTAVQINTALSRTGPVWQREYFDHLVCALCFAESPTGRTVRMAFC